MYYVPKKQPKIAGILSVALYGVAAALYVIGEFFTPRLLYQLFALVFVAVGLFFTSRYILTDYKYVIKDIDAKGEEASFSIVRLSGKREAIVANFDIISVYALEKCRKSSDFEAKHGKVTKIYNYTSNFASPDTYKLAINFNNMKVLFSVELSDEFAAELRARMVQTADNDTENPFKN